MRHRRRTRKLGRKTAHRQAMLRNMVTSLLEHGRIVTTVPRAREVRRLADKMVTLAKEGSLHARRQALSVIMDKKVVHKLFTHWAPELAGKNGGYTRIVKVGPRRGDAAMMCYLEMATDVLEKSKGKARSIKKLEETESVIPQAQPVAKEEPEEAVESQPVTEDQPSEGETETKAEMEVSTESEEEATEQDEGTESSEETVETPEEQKEKEGSQDK